MIEVTNIGPNEARTFEIEFKKHPQVFARIHHPSCGHCKAMEGEWDKFEKQIKNNYTGDAGIFNVHANAAAQSSHPSINKVEGFPTLIALINDKPKIYEGERNAENMLKFCTDNFNLQSKTQKGGKKNIKGGTETRPAPRRELLYTLSTISLTPIYSGTRVLNNNLPFDELKNIA